MDRPSSPKLPDTPARRIALLVAFANLMVFALVALSLHSSYQNYSQRAAVIARNTSRLVAQGVAGDLDRIDMGLRAVVDEVARQRAAGGIDRQSLGDFLTRQQARLPMTDGLRVADADGRVTLGSGGVASPIMVADRDYFMSLRAEPGRGLVISKPMVGRISHKWAVAVGRTLAGPDGGFVGIVYATVFVDWFVDQFARLDISPHGAVGLRGNASRAFDLMARWPTEDPTGPARVSDTFRDVIAANPGGATYQANAGSDDVSRTYSFQPVGAYPLIAVVGLATEDVLGDWWREAAKLTLLAAVFTLVTVLAARATLRARGMAELVRARAEAERASAAKTQLMTALAHDLHQPLITLRLHLELLAGEVDSPQQATRIGLMEDAVGVGEAMLESVMEGASVAAGRLVAKRRPLALDDLVLEITTGNLVAAAKRGLDLRLRLGGPAEGNTTIDTDPVLCQRLLRNLVHNALRYTSQGGVLVSLRWRRHFALVQVWDTGPGIADHDLPHIFEEFYRGNSSRGGGLGLGLSTVAGLARLLDHPVTVCSRLGRGSVFSVRIPRPAIPLAAPSPVPEPASAD